MFSKYEIVKGKIITLVIDYKSWCVNLYKEGVVV